MPQGHEERPRGQCDNTAPPHSETTFREGQSILIQPIFVSCTETDVGAPERPLNVREYTPETWPR